MSDANTPPRTRGRPARISHETILAAALEIGLPNLTLTAVAERLNVTVQALYRYFTDREELVNAVTESIVQRFPEPPDHGLDWRDWAITLANELRKMYDEMPGLADRAMAVTQATPGVLNRYETSIRIALRSGFDVPHALWATRAVLEFVFSWVAREQRRAAEADRTGVPYLTNLLSVAEAREAIDLPNLAHALRQTFDDSSDLRFDYTLRCLIDGLSRDRGGPHPRVQT